MHSIKKILTFFAIILVSQQSLAGQNIPGHITVQAGGYFVDVGKTQQINIQGLVGDRYNFNNSSDGNALVGLGYYLDGKSCARFDFLYGLNAFYLFQTKVQGDITQENLYTNLAYEYNVSQVPIYVDVKGIYKYNPRVGLTLDLGIGPNVIMTRNYQDTSLDGGITLPDRAFHGSTVTRFSASAGVGIQINNAINGVPLECGYRFFYLGKGGLTKSSNQIINNLETGTIYANALLCALRF